MYNPSYLGTSRYPFENKTGVLSCCIMLLLSFQIQMFSYSNFDTTYSRPSLSRTLKGNEILFEIAGVRDSKGGVKFHNFQQNWSSIQIIDLSMLEQSANTVYSIMSVFLSFFLFFFFHSANKTCLCQSWTPWDTPVGEHYQLIQASSFTKIH